MTLESRPIAPKPLKPKLLPKKPSTRSSSETATKPSPAAITHLWNRVPTLMLKNLYAARVPATAAIVPSTAPMTSVVGDPSGCVKMFVTTLLKAPTKTPSKAA